MEQIADTLQSLSSAGSFRELMTQGAVPFVIIGLGILCVLCSKLKVLAKLLIVIALVLLIPVIASEIGLIF